MLELRDARVKFGQLIGLQVNDPEAVVHRYVVHSSVNPLPAQSPSGGPAVSYAPISGMP